MDIREFLHRLLVVAWAAAAATFASTGAAPRVAPVRVSNRGGDPATGWRGGPQ